MEGELEKSECKCREGESNERMDAWGGNEIDEGLDSCCRDTLSNVAQDK